MTTGRVPAETAETDDGGRSRGAQRAPTTERIAQWIALYVAQAVRMNVHAVNHHRPFTDYGLDSAASVMLSGDLESWLGCRLPATLVWEYPTIAALSRHLAGDEVEPETADVPRGGSDEHS